MTILAKIGFCRQKPIFASPVFTTEKPVFSTFRQKPANPGTEFN